MWPRPFGNMRPGVGMDTGMAVDWRPLDRESFAPFGDVIETADDKAFAINAGTTVRHEDLAAIDVTENGGRPVISIFESRPFGFPIEIAELERHPLSSQAFVPLDPHPFAVVVAPAGEGVDAKDIRAFLTDGVQGVNFRRGVWHHPVIVTVPMRFLVIDRGTAEPNCDLVAVSANGAPPVLDAPPGAVTA